MNILVLHLDPHELEVLAASIADDGHDVTAVSAPAPVPVPPDVVVVCLDAEPQRTLDLAARIGADAKVEVASILFVGGTQSALKEAQRRFPTASFARLDTLRTALASMAE